MSNSNSWNLEDVNLSEDKVNKNIKEITKQINQDVNFLLNLIKKYDPLELLKFVAFHTDEVLEKSKVNKNLHNEEVAYSQMSFILKFVASNPNSFGDSKNLTDFSWKKFNRTYSNYENHLIKYTDNLILKENIDSSVRSRMQEQFYSYMFPVPKTKFENIGNKKKLLKLTLQPFVDKINATFISGLDNILDSIELMAKVGTKGIYDLNQDCDLFTKRSQSKIEELKLTTPNKTNKELLEKIIVEEGWQKWINSIQARSEQLDLFDVMQITKMNSEELDLLSVEASSQYSNNFGWLTESAGLDDSLFIKVNEKYYCFDGMFIFDKAYHVIKKAVLKKFPNYENTWNSIEKEKSGLLPVSIFAGVFGHFNYSLNYEVEDSYFTAFFENDKGNVYVQVPMQHGYNIPLNPIKDIVITEYALKSYDLAVKDFDKIESPIVVLDSIDEITDRYIEDSNIFYISYSYLASILNEWNEIRLLRDALLGASPENIEVKEEEHEVLASNQAMNIEESNHENLNVEEDTDEELEYLEELFDEEIEESSTDLLEEVDEEMESTSDFSQVTEDNIDDLFMKDSEIPEYSNYQVNGEMSKIKEEKQESNDKVKSFSFFDVLNNVAKGKEPLEDKNELVENDTIEDSDLPKDEINNLEESNNETNIDDSKNIETEKQTQTNIEESEIENGENKLNKNDNTLEKSKEAQPKAAGFSFLDVLNNVASGKDPLTGENDSITEENIDKSSADTNLNISEEEIPNDINELDDLDLNYSSQTINLSNIEHYLDEDEDEEEFVDEEETAEIIEVERSDDELREVFDDDSIDGRDFIADYNLTEVELNSIVEPEDEDEEVVETPIYDIQDEDEAIDISTDDMEKIETPIYDIKDEDDTVGNSTAAMEKIETPSVVNKVATAAMINSVNDILDEIDDSDLDDYGTSSIEDDDTLDDYNEELTEIEDDIFDEDIEDEEIVEPIVSENNKVDLEESILPVDKLKAIEENRIITEDIPTIESLWPSSIVDIVDMSEKLDDSPFFNICKSNDVELLNAIDYLIGQALESQEKDGKDKMFTIPESNLTIVLPTNQNDQLKKWERMNSLGALMYSKDMESWNALTLNYDEDKKLKSIREWNLTKESYSPVDWKFVVTTGSRLKKKNKN